MRKLFLLCVIALLTVSCKKDNNNPSGGINGRWEYRGGACYCSPATDANGYKPGNGNIISFAGNSYKTFAKNVLQTNGTYSISVVTTGGTTKNRISFSNDTIYFPPYIKIEGTRMTFYGDTPVAADGVEVYYEKIK